MRPYVKKQNTNKRTGSLLKGVQSPIAKEKKKIR
jgi:hypothetical protein